MNITEVNQMEKSKKKLIGIAQKNNLDYQFVYFLFSFFWNFDKEYLREVKNLDFDNEYINRKNIICDELKIKEETLSKKDIIEKLYNRLLKVDNEKLKNNFMYGSLNGHNCYVSEYSSFYYLKNASKEKLDTLFWYDKNNQNEMSIMKCIFLKLLNSGLDARNSLIYCYSDLSIDLPYDTKKITFKDWSNDFIQELNENNGSKITLTELIKLLKKYCKGDKLFLQTVLEALSYSGILKVQNHEVDNIFLPDYRDTKSKHFNSNEWKYPLRFWNE